MIAMERWWMSQQVAHHEDLEQHSTDGNPESLSHGGRDELELRQAIHR